MPEGGQEQKMIVSLSWGFPGTLRFPGNCEEEKTGTPHIKEEKEDMGRDGREGERGERIGENRPLGTVTSSIKLEVVPCSAMFSLPLI